MHGIFNVHLIRGHYERMSVIRNFFYQFYFVVSIIQSRRCVPNFIFGHLWLSRPECTQLRITHPQHNICFCMEATKQFFVRSLSRCSFLHSEWGPYESTSILSIKNEYKRNFTAPQTRSIHSTYTCKERHCEHWNVSGTQQIECAHTNNALLLCFRRWLIEAEYREAHTDNGNDCGDGCAMRYARICSVYVPINVYVYAVPMNVYVCVWWKNEKLFLQLHSNLPLFFVGD